MTSSYTNLGIELMVTGANSGTWGSKTNTNLEIVEQIQGYVNKSIAGGAQTTDLAIADGSTSSSDARNLIIELSGTITGNQVVTVPDGIEKSYIVYNNTSGAFTVEFKTFSGTGTTFSTTDKGIKIVYSNGTNIIDAAFTEVSSDISPQLSGDLDLNSNDITGTGNINTTGNIDITGNIDTTGNIDITGTLTADNDVQADSIGVGTAPSGTTGQIRATDDITAFYSSDAMLKEDIINIPNPLEALKKLNGVLFNWKDEWIKKQGGEDGYFVRKKDVGVIAQEVEKVLPEAVAQRKDGIKAVKYDRLTCLLIEAVKVLSDKVEKLNKENK
jgi:hypothetical protein